MAKMIFDEKGLLKEPCLSCNKPYLSCDKPYAKEIGNEWHCDCDEEKCPHRYQDAIEILLDIANELQLIPESKQGWAFKMAIEDLKQHEEGYWISGFGNTSCECSKCGGNGDSQYKYCPWCGERKGGKK